ncbi:MAG: SH3 domain-containing protein [Parasphingorhabdus sp.]|uniref:SH3 domain-containing protein n=1 Tax=Parasphingorhabdus sp. TaxID=2709688 RepID=UPI0030034456
MSHRGNNSLNMRYSGLRILSTVGLLVSTLMAASPSIAQQPPPYWASIDEPVARMRTGPSTEYPTMWIYKRERLPVKVVERYKAWRKVEDPDGAQGWMHARLLSAARTALVIGKKGTVQVLRSRPRSDAKTIWRVEPGVVGRITECENSWCLFDVTGRRGYIHMDMIWGDEPLK